MSALSNIEITIPKYLKEYFESLKKEHGIEITLPQQRWYTMKYKELGEDIRQEYPSTPEEAFMGSSEGFWYLKELSEAREQGRITNVPYQNQIPVQTAWDLGFRDKTSIWFYQQLPSGAIHVIDYYENSGEGLIHYVSHMKTTPYKDNLFKHHMPHDAAAHDLASGLSVAQQAKELGLDVNILSRYNSSGSRSKFMLEIQRVRNLLSRCYIDEGNCAVGIKCLENYRKKWNESMSCYIDDAIHDWASHGSDAFRYLSQAVETQARRKGSSTIEEDREKIRKARRRRI